MGSPAPLPGENFQRLTAQPACDIEFFDPPWLPLGRGEKQRRLLAEGEHHRATFTARPIFLDDQARVMDVIDENTQGIFVLHDHPVDTHIDPTGFGLAGKNARSRPDIIAAVQFVPFWRGKFQQVDVFSGKDVFQNRTGFYFLWRERFEGLELILPCLDQIHVGQIRVEPQPQSHSPDAGHGVGRNTISARKSLDVVEQKHGMARRAGDRLRQCADFFVAVGAVDL